MTIRALQGSVDLIELSDMFRRAAEFEQPETVKTLVALSLQLSNNLTWIYGEYPADHSVNQSAAAAIEKTLTQIAAVAQSAGLSTVQLHIHQDNPDTAFIQEQILSNISFPVTFTFREEDYDTDNSPAGQIREHIETIFNEDIRGLAAVSDDLKYKWALEEPYSPQMRLF